MGSNPTEKRQFSTVFAWTCVTAFLVFVAWSVVPSPSDVTYRYGRESSHAGGIPFFAASEGSTLDVRLHLDLAPVFPAEYLIKPDDCLTSLVVNGVGIEMDKTVCFATPSVLTLGPFLHPGRNELTFTIDDRGGLGGLMFRPALTDPLFLKLIVALVVCIAFLGLAILALVPKARPHGSLWLLFLAGVILRIWYAAVVPYTQRGHDTDAHIQYIRYVWEHWSIPPALEGWEYYQAPLYYFIAALRMKASGLLTGRSFDALLMGPQQLSVLLSILTLVAAVWIAFQLFPTIGERIERLLFCGIIATLPAIVFFSSRITNDALVQPLSFLALGLLIRWWRTGKDRDWYFLFIVLGLGLLTKNNVVALVPAALGCLLARRGVRWKKKQSLTALGLLVLLSMDGWLLWRRFFVETDRALTMVVNTRGVNEALRVANDVGNYLFFHPLAALRAPFLNPWVDASGRQFYWDYLFRSSFFGEFSFEKLHVLSAAMVFLGLGMIVLMLWGIATVLRRHAYRALPLLLAALFFLASHLTLRAFLPYAPLQDFRYVTLLAVPGAYFAVRGIRRLSPAFREYAVAWCAGFVVLNGWFLALLLSQGG